MSEVALRRATEADVATIVAFRVQLQREARNEDVGPALQARLTDFITAGISKGDVIVVLAEDDGAPIAVALGYVRPYMPRNTIDGDAVEARIHNVFVDPAYRRTGVGRRMLASLIDELKTHHPYRIVLSPTDMARPLYALLGFRPSSELVLGL